MKFNCAFIILLVLNIAACPLTKPVPTSPAIDFILDVPTLGYALSDMKSHPDYRAQGILRANAFQGKTSIIEEELNYRLKFYSNRQRDPIYHPDTDLCVMAEDGQFVAGAEALINAHCLEADIERVCTHSNFRKRGFARAVTLECMYRLKELGIRNVYITGYSQAAIGLYGSMGHADEFRSFIYERS